LLLKRPTNAPGCMNVIILYSSHRHKILRVSWTEKRTNLSVVEDVKPKRSLEATVLRLKLRYFGHVMRAKRSLERDIMLGQVAGHRKQGKPRMRWLDSIKKATGLRLEDLREAVQDRKKWRTPGGIKNS
jgi:hypothetical protein